jgi:hypothetical protein
VDGIIACVGTKLFEHGLVGIAKNCSTKRNITAHKFTR